MSDVSRFWSHEASNIRCVREADFDRVQAENQALQQRLTVQDQRVDEQVMLLREVSVSVTGRNGTFARIPADWFDRRDAALNPTTEAASHDE